MPLDQTGAGGLPAVFSASRIVQGGVATFDPASRLGIAYGHVAAPVTELRAGFVDLPHIGGEGCRYASAHTVIVAFLEVTRPSKLVLEAPLPIPAQTNWRSCCQAFALRGLFYAEGFRYSAAVVEVDALTVRSEVMGGPRLSKDLVKRAVLMHVRSLGIRVTDHNAADAAMLFLWHRQQMLGVAPKAGPLFRQVAA